MSRSSTLTGHILWSQGDAGCWHGAIPARTHLLWVQARVPACWEHEAFHPIYFPHLPPRALSAFSPTLVGGLPCRSPGIYATLSIAG